MKYYLGLVIESNNDYIDKNRIQKKRYFEKEAIKSVIHWRKYGGQYKDIDIFCICITKNIPSNETINKLKKLNVIFINHYEKITDSFDCGFYNKILGCKIIDQYYIPKKEDYRLIHIDLDMYLLKEPKLGSENSCLVYDQLQMKTERKIIDKDLPVFNTCFIISKPGLYNLWWNKLLWTLNNYKTINIQNLDYRKIEELSFDLLSEEILINSLDDLIFGETYTDIEIINKKNNICFHHYHIYDNLQYDWLTDYKKFKMIK